MSLARVIQKDKKIKHELRNCLLGDEKMKPHKNIEEVLKQHKKELAEKYRVKEIGVFGSYVRGEQKKRSDVDILVEFEEVPDLFKFLELERYLERLLGEKVDLVEKSALRPQLKEEILSEVVYV